MKAYKFRSADQLHFIIDILINKRLYCCPSAELNDIREGDMRVGNAQEREVEIFEYGLEVQKQLRNLRVCGLAKSYNNHLLWAHYAGGYNGVAIELELDDKDAIEVSYSNDYIFCSNLAGSFSCEEVARQTLTKKYKDWNYEGEIRLITKSEYYPLNHPISCVIAGSRLSPALTKALNIICAQINIPLMRMVVADWGIYTVNVPR